MPWLENDARRFDVIWASGVLYHMTEPLRLLELLSARTDRLYLWTHFYGDDEVPSHVKVRHVPFAGTTVPQYERPYFMPGRRASCGGVFTGRAWLRRRDILSALETFGFKRVEIAFEDSAGKMGPSFAVVAQRN